MSSDTFPIVMALVVGLGCRHPIAGSHYPNSKPVARWSYSDADLSVECSIYDVDGERFTTFALESIGQAPVFLPVSGPFSGSSSLNTIQHRSRADHIVVTLGTEPWKRELSPFFTSIAINPVLWMPLLPGQRFVTSRTLCPAEEDDILLAPMEPRPRRDSAVCSVQYAKSELPATASNSIPDANSILLTSQPLSVRWSNPQRDTCRYDVRTPVPSVEPWRDSSSPDAQKLE